MKAAWLLVVFVACVAEDPRTLDREGFGQRCVQIPDAWVTPCESPYGAAGWCVVTEVGASPTCRMQCDASPCSETEIAVPIVGNHCYCRPRFRH
jgi:hypothetical protein